MKVPQFWLENVEYWFLRTLYIGRWSNKSSHSVAVFWKMIGQTSCTKKMATIHSVLFCKNLGHLILVAFWKFLNFGSKMVDIELCAQCMLNDEATKVVILLLFFKKDWSNFLHRKNGNDPLLFSKQIPRQLMVTGNHSL